MCNITIDQKIALTAKMTHRGGYDEDDVEKRRQWVETFTGTDLQHVNGKHSGLL